MMVSFTIMVIMITTDYLFFFIREKIAATEDELVKEKGCVANLIGASGGACDIRGEVDTTVPGEN